MCDRIKMRKHNNSFKISNHLPAVLPSHMCNINKGMTLRLPSGHYRYSDRVKKQTREMRSIMGAQLAIFSRINMFEGLIKKSTNSWLGYKKNQKQSLLWKNYTRMTGFSITDQKYSKIHKSLH